ncbi:MAG: hypothetical protein IPO63_13295 [Bacteroidetes bacterium]|nr:hypothetical protein [Bacteroidota bacterium]
MKNQLLQLFKIVFILFLLGITVKVFPFEKFKTKKSAISIMNDVTEKHSTLLEPQSLIQQFKIKENKFEGYTFRLINLSDVSLNPVLQYSIEASPMILSNEIKRDSEIKQFEDSILLNLSNSQSDTSGRSHSSVYSPIAKELTILSMIEADTKILVVNSDLMENTPKFSLYNKNTYFNSAEVKRIFNESYPLPNLKGIEVYLIYQPNSPNTDNTYKLISQVYKELLTEKGGAEVYTLANFIKTK